MLRLDRMLVTLGKGSRSEMQKAIRGGRVRVNGDVQRDPSAQVAEDAEILLNGEKLDTRLTRHVMLHKPAGLLTAARDKKQPTVMDLLPPEYAAIGCMPVGRLDKDTTGLLLLTTDGEFESPPVSPRAACGQNVSGDAGQAGGRQGSRSVRIGAVPERL